MAAADALVLLSSASAVAAGDADFFCLPLDFGDAAEEGAGAPEAAAAAAEEEGEAAAEEDGAAVVEDEAASHTLRA